MRALLLSLALLPALAAAAPQHAEARIASEPGACLQDLGYVLEVGPDAKAVSKAADARLRERFPKARSTHHADSVKKGEVLSHVVVVRTTVRHAGCESAAYSVGFGKDAPAALKDALRLLGKRHVWFKRDRDGHTVVESRAL